MPVCSTCNDTHMMDLHDAYGDSRKVMCTRCPTPCQKCRKGGNGAYCETTPCGCDCHGAERNAVERESPFPGVARVREEYVKDELARRTVAQAVANADHAHMVEAADLLRNMCRGDAENVYLERLSAWYSKDIEKGATR